MSRQKNGASFVGPGTSATTSRLGTATIVRPRTFPMMAYSEPSGAT